jgi:hypothetical protein
MVDCHASGTVLSERRTLHMKIPHALNIARARNTVFTLGSKIIN